MEKIFENFTVTLLKLNKLISKIKTLEMKEYGLKAIHVMCVYYLSEHPDGLTASELCRLTLEDKGAISRGLALLAEKDYISYDPNKYGAEIYLTDEGRKLASAVTERSERAVNAGSAVLTDKERELFYKSLHVIADNLQKYYDGLTEK